MFSAQVQATVALQSLPVDPTSNAKVSSQASNNDSSHRRLCSGNNNAVGKQEQRTTSTERDCTGVSATDVSSGAPGEETRHTSMRDDCTDTTDGRITATVANGASTMRAKAPMMSAALAGCFGVESDDEEVANQQSSEAANYLRKSRNVGVNTRQATGPHTFKQSSRPKYVNPRRQRACRSTAPMPGRPS